MECNLPLPLSSGRCMSGGFASTERGWWGTPRPSRPAGGSAPWPSRGSGGAPCVGKCAACICCSSRGRSGLCCCNKLAKSESCLLKFNRYKWWNYLQLFGFCLLFYYLFFIFSAILWFLNINFTEYHFFVGFI